VISEQRLDELQALADSATEESQNVFDAECRSCVERLAMNAAKTDDA
jgi:hypothetical protein